MFQIFQYDWIGVVVKAFDLGIASMKKGEKAILTCASEYAYGAAGSPPNIPPNATLLFEVYSWILNRNYDILAIKCFIHFLRWN